MQLEWGDRRVVRKDLRGGIPCQLAVWGWTTGLSRRPSVSVLRPLDGGLISLRVPGRPRLRNEANLGSAHGARGLGRQGGGRGVDPACPESKRLLYNVKQGKGGQSSSGPLRPFLTVNMSALCLHSRLARDGLTRWGSH